MAPKPVSDHELPPYTPTPNPPIYTEQPATLSAPAPSPPTPPGAEGSRSRLFKAALPLFLLVSLVVTALATPGLIKYSKNVAEASVDSDPTKWALAARTKVYEPCYLGCADCDDPNYAWDACQRTVQLQQPDGAAACDASHMWNWADRYPAACLAAMGAVLRAAAVADAERSAAREWVPLNLLAGVAGGLLACVIVTYWGGSRDRKAALARTAVPPPYAAAAAAAAASASGPGAGKRRVKMLLLGFLGLFGRGARAYACAGLEPAWDQPFVDPNGTVSGVVHGWLSSCHSRQYCHSGCSSFRGGGRHHRHYGPHGQPCGRSGGGECKTSCCPVTYTDRSPRQYVENVTSKVEACGFKLVDAVPAGTTTRVANANIERKYWVKISVSGLNATGSKYTDPMVVCLHDIGDS